ncbi:uncharacterized protein LOC134817001 isoform X2 [Bolinopsis microptera]|uniref:uncharacterized protein LOC134817001 isoform X2 n=1 Tax=Bolinopsis microptera TaxID=2820187 RepID=UPI00307AC4A6
MVRFIVVISILLTLAEIHSSDTGEYKDLSDCFTWGKKFAPTPEMKLQPIEALVFTEVKKPLNLIRECYHNSTCLFVTCDNTVMDNVTCNVWPGWTGFTTDYFIDEKNALVSHLPSWTYNTTCQYWSYRDTLQHCLEYFIPPSVELNAKKHNVVKTTSLVACYDTCKNSKKRIGFTYYWKSNDCWIHDKVFGTVLSNNETSRSYSLVSARMGCLFQDSIDEVCYKREISYRGDELEELRKGSVTQEAIDFRYAYRNPSICNKRCMEYNGNCFFFTLDVITLKCTLHGPNVTAEDNIFSYTANWACLSGLQCPDAITGELYKELEIKCLLPKRKAKNRIWRIDGIPVETNDPSFEMKYLDPSNSDSGYVSLFIHNVTERQIEVNITVKMKHEHSHVIKVTSILYKEPPMLEPFDVTESKIDMTELQVYNMSEPEQFRLPEGYVTYGADLATDGNIYTCFWSKSSGADDLAFFSMAFEKPYFVDEVKVHMMFFISSGLREQWLDGGNYDYDNCHLTADHYYACKENDGPLKVVMRNCSDSDCSVYDEYFCGEINTNQGLSQEDQIYKVSCRSVGDMLVVLRETPGNVRICELQISNYPQECPDRNYLTFPGHVCLPCPDRYNSLPYSCQHGEWECDPDTNLAEHIYMCSSDFATWDLTSVADDEVNGDVTLSWNPEIPDNYTQFPPANAFDRHLYTCVALTSTELYGGPSLWLKVNLGDLYMVKNVTVYTVFEDDWFFYPPRRYGCHTNNGDYENCKEAEINSVITLYDGETEVKECGVLAISAADTLQADQIYTVTCNGRGDSIILSAGTSALRICEVVVESGEQNCTTDQFFEESSNTCHSCPEGELSYGCQTGTCSSDRTTLSSSMWEPTAEYTIDYEATAVSILEGALEKTTIEEIEESLLFLSDKDLSTVTDLVGVTDWIQLDLGENWKIGGFTIHTMFFSDWFFCPTQPCLHSISNYESCKDEESISISVGFETSDRFEMNPTHDLTQNGQIYNFECNVVGQYIGFFSLSLFRISEIVVLRGTAELCKANHFLKEPNNICLQCDSGLYSHGCSSTSCTEDRVEVSTSHWEPYGIGEEPEKLQPESVSQSITTLSQKASYATDNDLSTYSLASASDSDIWFKVEFSQDKNVFLYAVQVFQEFYSDWFYCQDPEDYCRVSQENYQECKNKGTDIQVDVYSDDTLINNCGTIELTDGLTQTSQEYQISCGYEGNAVLFSKSTSGEGWIKLYEVVAYTQAQDCPGGQHLVAETNTCVLCLENTYSAGGFLTLECTSCPEGFTAPAGFASEESDCELDYVDVVVGPYSIGETVVQEGLDLLGTTTLAQHVQGKHFKHLLRISWFQDRVTVESLCNDNTMSIVCEAEDQVMVVTELEHHFMLYFYSLVEDQNDADSPRKFVLDYSECREEEREYELVFLSTIPSFGPTTVSDCEVIRVDDRWDLSIAAVPSQLPAQSMSEVDVGCEAGYFNGGDKVITCLGDSFYIVQNNGPLCLAQPVEDHQFTDIDISLSGALPECNNAEGTQAADLDLTTCTGAQSADGLEEAWVDFQFDEITYVNNASLYTVFYDNWYDNNEACVLSEEAFQLCKETEVGTTVDLYLEDDLVKSCGSITENKGLTQEEQIFKFSCDGVGDRIRISNPNLEDNGIVKMFEVVITSLECEDPVTPLNGILKSQNYTHVEFQCNEGYILLGKSLLTCQESESWEDSPICTPDCGEVQVPENGVVESTNVTQTTFNCNEGFVLLGRSVVSCLESRVWENSPECTIDCGVPQAPDNGILELENFTHATFSCDESYHLIGSSLVTCQEYGQWEDGPKCHVDCGEAEAPSNGVIEFQSFELVTIKCNIGFGLFGESTLTCQESGSWKTGSICYLDCGDPQTPLNGIVESENYTHITFQCIEGYRLLGNSVVSCLESRNWEDSPKCTIYCGEVQTPQNGMVESDNFTIATFKCDDGFTRLGSSVITCLETGQWEQHPECIIDCGDCPAPADGFVQFMNMTNAVVECNWGFINIGSTDLECLDTGEWQESPLCITDCGEPEDILNGFKDFDNLTNARFVCNDDFYLVGNEMIRCLESEIWEETPWCAPNCGGVLAPANGYVEVQNLTRAVIMCDEGYALSLSGGSVVSCLGSGLWSEYGAQCEIIPFSKYIYYDKEEGALQLSMDNPESNEGLFGIVSFSQLDQDSNEEVLVEVEWFYDKIKLTSFCNDDVFVTEGEEQILIFAELTQDFVFYFDTEEGSDSDLPKYVQSISDCKERLTDGGVTFISTNAPNLKESVLPDCEDVSDRWDHSTVASPSQLPSEFQDEVDVGCEAGYFNGGDKVITCLGDIYYHVGDKQPHCEASPLVKHRVNITSASVSSSLDECGDASGSAGQDMNLKTCSGSEAIDGEAWIEFVLDEMRYVNNVSIFTNFYDNWYNTSDPCVASEEAYRSCKMLESGVIVDLYRNGVFVKTCGTITTNQDFTQVDQTYSVSCDAEGDMVKLRKSASHGYIKVYEVVVTSLDCPELTVLNGIVTTDQDSSQYVLVTCDPTCRYYTQTSILNLTDVVVEGKARCLNGKWTPLPYCLPTCESNMCDDKLSCRLVHAIPLCYSDEGGGTLAVSRPVFDATRLVRWLGRWRFRARCPGGHVVWTCRCLQTADFPGNCEGSEISVNGTDCYFTNSPDNNLVKMTGYAVCVKNKTVPDHCDYFSEIPELIHTRSTASNHPSISCAVSSHPSPVSCTVAVIEGDSLTHWRESEDVTKGTSEVVVTEDGVCSVKCFDESLGSCVLSLICAASGDTSPHIMANCPTCKEMICPPFRDCRIIDNLPTCTMACEGFLVPDGHVNITGTTAEVTCDNKYSYSVNSKHMCTLDGRWEPLPGKCVLQDCETYQCEENEYCRLVTPDPPPYIHSDDPFHNPISPQCFKKCPEFTILNGFVENDNSSAYIVCKTSNYRLRGSRSLECLPTGLWSDIIPSCDPTFCSVMNCETGQFCLEMEYFAICRSRCPALTIQHGTVDDRNLTALITCDIGYFPDYSDNSEHVGGDIVITCTQKGIWNKNIPHCRPKCPEPAQLTEGTGTQHTTLSSVTTTCHVTHILVGSAARECGEDGQWSGDPASCHTGSCDLVTCPAYFKCGSGDGFAKCVQFIESDFEDFLSACLQRIQYEDDCDKEIAEIEDLIPDSFIHSFANSILKVKLDGNTQPYFISKKFLRKITPREKEFSEQFMTMIIKIVEHYTEHIETLLYRENREVLVAKCMLMINSNIRAIQHKNTEERPTRTKKEARQAWLDASKKHRNNPGKKETKNPAYSGIHSGLC